MGLLKIAGRNRIFSPLRIEAKRIQNLVIPSGLWDSKMTNRGVNVGGVCGGGGGGGTPQLHFFIIRRLSLILTCRTASVIGLNYEFRENQLLTLLTVFS